MSETQTLLHSPSQPAAANGGRSTHTYKVAGLTVLACVLVMSQTMIIYFLVTESHDIKSLQEERHNLEEQLMKGSSASVRGQLPSSFGTLTFDEKSSTGAPETTVSPQATQCQLEASGAKPAQVPGFRPQCDGRGLYQLQQCFMQACWCVNPATGEQLPGSLSEEEVTCSKAVHTAGLHTVL